MFVDRTDLTGILRLTNPIVKQIHITVTQRTTYPHTHTQYITHAIREVVKESLSLCIWMDGWLNSSAVVLAVEILYNCISMDVDEC